MKALKFSSDFHESQKFDMGRFSHHKYQNLYYVTIFQESWVLSFRFCHQITKLITLSALIKVCNCCLKVKSLTVINKVIFTNLKSLTFSLIFSVISVMKWKFHAKFWKSIKFVVIWHINIVHNCARSGEIFIWKCKTLKPFFSFWQNVKCLSFGRNLMNGQPS